MALIHILTLATLALALSFSPPLASSNDTPRQRNDSELRDTYEQWMAKHGRAYNEIGEEERRFEIFKDNLAFVESHNSVPNRTYKVGLNRFADMTNDEYRRDFLGTRSDPKRRLAKAKRASRRYVSRAADALPEEIDWRRNGAVNPVKNQGTCG